MLKNIIILLYFFHVLINDTFQYSQIGIFLVNERWMLKMPREVSSFWRISELIAQSFFQQWCKAERRLFITSKSQINWRHFSFITSGVIQNFVYIKRERGWEVKSRYKWCVTVKVPMLVRNVPINHIFSNFEWQFFRIFIRDFYTISKLLFPYENKAQLIFQVVKNKWSINRICKRILNHKTFTQILSEA